MEETVTKYSGDKFSLYLEIMEAKEKQAEMERQLQEEKYLRRTQRIYEYHERQQQEALQLRECLEFVTSHAGVLESALRGSNGNDAVPLSAALVGLVAPLQRCMQQCVANATTIRRALAGRHQNQMDAMLNKMERELRVWTEFLQRALDSTATTEALIDNLHNIISEQRRCVSEISSSGAFRSLCSSPPAAASPPSPAAHPALPSHACSTPIDRD